VNFTRQIWNNVAGKVGRNSSSRLKVLNLTRQTVLATSIEVADHGRARRKGLLGRDSLRAGEGLWIIPCESVHTFGMRFAIDLVYLDRKRRVKKVRSSVPPWRLSACLSAHSVIELASGTIRSTQTSPGDYLEFSTISSVNESVDDPVASDPTVPTAPQTMLRKSPSVTYNRHATWHFPAHVYPRIA
jgi:uncharacterized membrane protein (UPF0127 family)